MSDLGQLTEFRSILPRHVAEAAADFEFLNVAATTVGFITGQAGQHHSLGAQDSDSDILIAWESSS